MSGPTFEGLVLAGGNSLRMGRDKAQLRTGAESWLEHQVRVLREAGCQRVRVAVGVGGGEDMAGYDLFYDRSPNLGPLEPIAQGLEALQESHLVVLAVDLPNMSAGFVRELLKRCEAGSGCVPRTAKGWEPLAAVYVSSLRTRASEHLTKEIFAIRELVDFGVGAGLLLPWDVDRELEAILRNVNCPQDLP